MPISEQEFSQMSAGERQAVLGKMRLEKEYAKLPSEDRTKINQLLKAQKEEPISQGEAAVRGAAQGLTFGFADEIVAGLSAAGQSFLGKEEFKPALEKALVEQRSRDKLAVEKFPKTFQGAEVAGTVATTLIPISGQVAIGARAAKSGSVIGKALGLTTGEIGRGAVRGVVGAAKGAIGGALTELGKAEDKSNVDLGRGAIIAGTTGAVANVAGPIARGLSNAAIKSPRIASAVFSGGKSEVLRKVVDVAKNIPTNEATAQRIEALKSLISTPVEKLGQGASNVLRGLSEVFEKQGGAGLVSAHVSLLDNPEYQQILDEVEKQQGLKAPRKGK